MEYKDNILQEVIRQVILSKRLNHGLTQNGLSIMSNITRQFISQIEAGKRLPSISTLSALANTYDSTLTNFFKEVDRLYPLIENGRVIVSPPEPYAAEKNTKATNYIGDIKKENEDEKGPL